MVDRVGLRRAFGTTRKHRSGRWGAEYTHPISRERVLPGHSFRTKADALKWLATAEVDLDRGQLLDPSGTKQTFESYATTWLAGRNDLRPKTLSLYDYLLRVHLLPHLGAAPMGKIDPATIRRWHGTVSAGDQSAVTIAKAYRLLRQIMQAAVDDMLLRANPCTLKNVSVEHSAERATPSIDEARRIADAIKPEYRLMVMLAAVAGLRRGECLALRRRNLIEANGIWTVVVDASIVFVKGEAILQPPKTSAGVRRLILPAVLAAVVEDHVATYGPFKPDDLVFVDRRTGETPTVTVWRRVWLHARDAPGRVHVPRLAPPCRHAQRHGRRKHPGVDGANGPLVAEGCAAIPAPGRVARRRGRVVDRPVVRLRPTSNV